MSIFLLSVLAVEGSLHPRDVDPSSLNKINQSALVINFIFVPLTKGIQGGMPMCFLLIHVCAYIKITSIKITRTTLWRVFEFGYFFKTYPRKQLIVHEHRSVMLLDHPKHLIGSHDEHTQPWSHFFIRYISALIVKVQKPPRKRRVK